jgi:hypothetical protein
MHPAQPVCTPSSNPPVRRRRRSRRIASRIGGYNAARFPGGVPERPKGTGCKPVGSAYGGSNPPAPTKASSVTPTRLRGRLVLAPTPSWAPFPPYTVLILYLASLKCCLFAEGLQSLAERSRKGVALGSSQLVLGVVLDNLFLYAVNRHSLGCAISALRVTVQADEVAIHVCWSSLTDA